MVHPIPIHTLYRHDGSVTCVDTSSHWNIVLSASMDGTLMVHTLYGGLYRHSIHNPARTCTRWCGISPSSHLLNYAEPTNSLESTASSSVFRCYSINGKVLASMGVEEKWQAFVFSSYNKNIVIVGGDAGHVMIYHVSTLACLWRMEMVLSPQHDVAQKYRPSIQSLTLSPEEMYLIVGLTSGHVIVLTRDGQYLRERLDLKLRQLGF